MKKFVMVKLLMIFCVNAYSFSDLGNFHNYSFIKSNHSYLEWLDTIKNNTIQTPDCNHAQEKPIATSRYEEHFNSISCPAGEKRLPPVQFSAKLSKSDENLSSETVFTKGHIKGVVAQKFYGTSSWNDALVLEKITKNGKVTGYNVTLSLCSFWDFLPKGSIINNLKFNGDLVLDSESKCSAPKPIIWASISNDVHGSIESVNTIFSSQSTDECPSIE